MFKGKRKSKGKRALIVTDVDPVQPKFRVEKLSLTYNRVENTASGWFTRDNMFAYSFAKEN